MWPWTLRPPERFIASVRDFSGRSRVMSAKSLTVVRRRAAEVGLYFLMPMSDHASLEQVDPVAFLQGDDRLLVVGALADAPAHPLDLAADDGGPDRLDVDVEQRLDRPGHVVLRGLPVDEEAVVPELLAGLVQLLGDERALDDVGGKHAQRASSEVLRACAAAEVRTSAFRRRSDWRFSPSGGSTSKSARFRTVRWRSVFFRSSTTRASFSLSRLVSSSRVALVLVDSSGKVSTMTSAFSRARIERAALRAPFRTCFGGR